MLSKLLTQGPTRSTITCLLSATNHGAASAILRPTNLQITLNKVPRRWGGHNSMVVEPTNWSYKKFKDSAHFFTLLGLIPVTVISVIVGIRANPELAEIPEGYEPRHWEYYKHPLTRWMARYMYANPDLNHECKLAYNEQVSETDLMSRITKNVMKTMAFYNDHQSMYYQPYYAEPIRRARDLIPFLYNTSLTSEGHFVDSAYKPWSSIPPVGYKPGDI